MRLRRPSLFTLLMAPAVLLLALFLIVQCDVSRAIEATQPPAASPPPATSQP